MRIALAFALLTIGLMLAADANAAEPLNRKSRIAAPPAQQTYTPPADYRVGAPEPQAWRTHNWYVGGVAGYNFGIVEREVEGEKPFSFIDGDETWQAGIVAGYLWRNARLGLGVEADYVVRDLGDFALDDGTASLRGRAGVFVAEGTFLYGTVGVAQAYTDAVSGDFRRGLVVGGGVEKDVAANLALRVEALHYRNADSHFEWGDEGSTAVRGGLLVKF
jgi:opacity protein-like surface antigen